MKINYEIPNRSIWSTISLILLGGFSYIQFVYYLIPGLLEFNSLKAGTTTLQDIGLIWVPIITYVLISVMICLMVNIFKPLKPYKEKGLIWGLIVGLIWGPIIGSTVGFIIGLTVTGGLVAGLIWVFITGPIIGFVGGFVAGLIEEFK